MERIWFEAIPQPNHDFEKELTDAETCNEPSDGELLPYIDARDLNGHS